MACRVDGSRSQRWLLVVAAALATAACGQSTDTQPVAGPHGAALDARECEVDAALKGRLLELVEDDTYAKLVSEHEHLREVSKAVWKPFKRGTGTPEIRDLDEEFSEAELNSLAALLERAPVSLAPYLDDPGSRAHKLVWPIDGLRHCAEDRTESCLQAFAREHGIEELEAILPPPHWSPAPVPGRHTRELAHAALRRTKRPPRHSP